MDTGTYAIPITADQADSMRQLATELREKYMDGLAQRAIAVGYNAESMHLQTMDDGSTWLLVHLAFQGDDAAAVHARLANYPENDFTRWFNPRFLSYTSPPSGPRSGVLPPVEELFSWRKGE